MELAGPSEVPGAGSVSVGRTQTDRVLRVIPKPASVSMNQLRLAACIAGQDQVHRYSKHDSPVQALPFTKRCSCFLFMLYALQLFWRLAVPPSHS
jgi:hypothetical protein